MITYSTIITAFASLVGFREEQNLTIARETSGLLTVGQTYKILTYVTGDSFTNVGASSNATGITFTATGTTPTTWTHASTLQNQSLVTSNSGLYVNDLPGVDLESVNKAIFLNETTLVQTETLTQYLSRIYPIEVQNLVKSFVDKSRNVLQTKELLYDGNVLNTYPIGEREQSACFVGYYFKIKDGYNVKMTIDKLSMQIDTAQSVKIFLYELSTKTAVRTWDLTISTPMSRIASTITDEILQYQNANGQGNAYLIGYYEYDSANPQTLQINDGTIIYYSEIPQNRYEELNKYMDFCPVVIDNSNLNWNTVTLTYDLPTIESDILTSYAYDYGYGLDLHFEIEMDFTDLIVKYKTYFAKALQYQLAKRLISDCLYSKEFNQVTESNRTNWTNIQLYLNNELNGYEFTKGNQDGRVEGLLQQLTYSFEGIDKICFPRRRTFIL